MKKTDLQENNPLSETSLFILLCLASGPKHGYAISKEVEVLSEKRVLLSISTLYTTLKRMLEEGWIERSGDLEESTDNPGLPRKTYALTERGRKILSSERERLTSLLAAVNKRLAQEGV